jgi:hypothetical protein
MLHSPGSRTAFLRLRGEVVRIGAAGHLGPED